MKSFRALLALVPLVVACSKDSTAPVPVPASLTLTPDTPTVLIDSVRQLSVTVRDQSGNVISDPTVSWLVFDTTVAQVDAHGLLSGHALGVTSLAVASGTSLIQVPLTTVTPVSALSVGYQGSCSLAPRGTAYCWGRVANHPITVPGGTLFKAIGSGNEDACGLDQAGSALCWFIGSGTTPGTFTPISTPVAVGGPAFTSLAIGFIYKCGLTAAGGAHCWQVAYDNLGIDTGFTAPVALAGTFASVSSTYSACAIESGGGTECWGPNYYGALGSHASDNKCAGYSKPCSSVPAAVDSSLPAVTIIATGWYHTCAATAAGVAYCWGDNSAGELGDTVTGSGCWFRQLHLATDSLYPCSEKPVPVRTPLRFTALTAGAAHSCGLTSTGAAYCWGDNSAGQFGDGTTTSSAVPVPAAGGRLFRSLSAFVDATCGIGLDGVAYCWGNNAYGLLSVSQAAGTTVTAPTRVLYQP